MAYHGYVFGPAPGTWFEVMDWAGDTGWSSARPGRVGVTLGGLTFGQQAPHTVSTRTINLTAVEPPEVAMLEWWNDNSRDAWYFLDPVAHQHNVLLPYNQAELPTGFDARGPAELDDGSLVPWSFMGTGAWSTDLFTALVPKGGEKVTLSAWGDTFNYRFINGSGNSMGTVTTGSFSPDPSDPLRRRSFTVTVPVGAVAVEMQFRSGRRYSNPAVTWTDHPLSYGPPRGARVLLTEYSGTVLRVMEESGADTASDVSLTLANLTR